MLGIAIRERSWMRKQTDVYVCKEKNGRGKNTRSVGDLPDDSANAAHGRVGELIEGVRGEVEVAEGASRASVSQLDEDGLALVWS